MKKKKRAQLELRLKYGLSREFYKRTLLLAALVCSLSDFMGDGKQKKAHNRVNHEFSVMLLHKGKFYEDGEPL